MSGSSTSARAARRRLLAAFGGALGGIAGRLLGGGSGLAWGRASGRALVGALAVGAGRPRAQVPTAPACDAQSPWPPRFRLDYVALATRGPLSLEGENELEFSADGTRYTLRSATRSVLFSAEQASAGELRGALLVPHEYHERSARRPPRSTHFDWNGERVTFSANADGGSTTQPRLQDRLSMLLQAGQQLRAQQAKGPVVLPVAGSRHVSTYRFELRGLEVLDLPAGRIEAHRLERPIAAEHDGLEVWIAPQLCWLPVRLRFVDDRGQVIQNRLRAARFD
jgi:hypothetical protein